MAQRVLTNPALSAPRQRLLPFSASELSYWASIPVIRYDTLQVMLDALLDYDQCMFPDTYLIAVPVALNKVPGPRSWHLWDVVEKDHEELYPNWRQGTMRRFARNIVRGIPPAQRSTMAWGRHMHRGEAACLPPWLLDHATLDMLEKSIRTVVWEAWPELQALVAAERKMVEESSRIYLEIGYLPYEDHPEKLPRWIRESSEIMAKVKKADDALASWYGIDLDKLVDAMLLPRHVVYASEGEPLLLCPETADEVTFGPVPELGLSGEDVATIRQHVEDNLGKAHRWRELPEKCKPHFEKLMSFMDEAELRERTEILEV